MIASTVGAEAPEMRELSLDEINQVTGAARDSGPAPAAAFAIAVAAFLGICAGAGYVLGHVIKGDEE